MSLTRPTVTGWSGLFNDTMGAPDVGAYTMLPLAAGGNRAHFEPKIARAFKSEAHRELRAALLALIGAASGGTATSTYKRAAAPSNPSAATPTPMALDALGGNRTIETVTVINRATTAGDITYLKDIFDGDLTDSSITYPVDPSGNMNQGPARF